MLVVFVTAGFIILNFSHIAQYTVAGSYCEFSVQAQVQKYVSYGQCV
jgi:hypothetical protein